MIRRAVTYGALAAAGVAAWTLIEYALGWHESRADFARYTAFAGLLAPLAAIVLALRAARRERPDGLPFSAGLMEGAAVTLVNATLSTIFFWIYYGYINRGYNDGGAPVDQVRTAKAVISGSLVFGLMVSTVCAAVMRTRDARPSVAP